MQNHAILCNTMQYHAIPCNTMQYNAIPYNTMQYNAIPCNIMQYHAIPCNTMQYHAIPCNTCSTMQYHASLITADRAYHCPVGSIRPFFPYYRSFYQSNMALRPRTSQRFVTINSKLPNELLTMVFQFLPFESLKNALLVCRLALL